MGSTSNDTANKRRDGGMDELSERPALALLCLMRLCSKKPIRSRGHVRMCAYAETIP